jgi:hypothetical protein
MTATKTRLLKGGGWVSSEVLHRDHMSHLEGTSDAR